MKNIPLANSPNNPRTPNFCILNIKISFIKNVRNILLKLLTFDLDKVFTTLMFIALFVFNCYEIGGK